MEWAKRMKIALGSAKGLSYLHDDCEYCSLSMGCLEHFFRIFTCLESIRVLCFSWLSGNPKTIHRDVKAANILIDNSYEPKVLFKLVNIFEIYLNSPTNLIMLNLMHQLADFGLARSCSDTETHVSTRVMGTFGYETLSIFIIQP